MAISALSLSLFNTTSSSTSDYSITPIDLSSLNPNNYSVPTPPKPISKMTPWDSNAPKTATDKLASLALASTSLFSGGLGKGPGSAIKSKNDHELFVIHNAVDKLKALAEVAANKNISALDRTRFNLRLQKGLAEIEKYANSVGLDGATLIAGRRFNSLSSSSFGNTTPVSFETAALVDGGESAIPPQFLAADSFSIKITNAIGSQNIAIDLSQMGSTPRTIGNVSSFINSKLAEANVETRFSRLETSKPSAIKNGTPIVQQKMKVSFGSGETVSFETGTGASQSAVYIAGAKTVNKLGQSVISRVDLGDLNNPITAFRNDLSATDGGANVRAMTQDDDGSVYMIADITGKIGTSGPRANSDVALQKLDSTGKVVWSRVLGSAATAQGFSIALSGDGTIAIAGAVDGKIDTSVNLSGDGRDSFVATFDADGRDLWTFQQGAAGADEVKDIAFDASGNLLILGKTTNPIGGASALGGTDVYLQSIDTQGAVRFTKSIGGANDDAPIGIKANGSDAYLAWNDAGSGRISRIEADTGNSLGADVQTSALGIEKIANFTIDASQKIYVTGNSNASAINDRAIGFDFATQTIGFNKDFAGSAIRALNVSGGRVDIAFEGTPDEGAANPNANQTLLKGFDAISGTQSYSIAVQGEAAGQVSITSTQGQSLALQALGLPQGELGVGDTSSLTDLTGLHAGDNFSISINGSAKRKIVIAQGETVQTLVAKINRFAGTYASATMLSKDGAKYLSLTPKGNAKVEIFAGEGKQNALKELGLDAGIAMAKPLATAKNYKPFIALELPTSVDLSDKTKSKSAMDALDGVLRRIRLGYREISTDPTMVELRKQTSSGQGVNAANKGAIAAYNKQTAAGQDALYRLGAG